MFQASPPSRKYLQVRRTADSLLGDGRENGDKGVDGEGEDQGRESPGMKKPRDEKAQGRQRTERPVVKEACSTCLSGQWMSSVMVLDVSSS